MTAQLHPDDLPLPILLVSKTGAVTANGAFEEILGHHELARELGVRFEVAPWGGEALDVFDLPWERVLRQSFKENEIWYDRVTASRLRYCVRGRTSSHGGVLMFEDLTPHARCDHFARVRRRGACARRSGASPRGSARCDDRARGGQRRRRGRGVRARRGATARRPDPARELAARSPGARHGDRGGRGSHAEPARDRADRHDHRRPNPCAPRRGDAFARRVAARGRARAGRRARDRVATGRVSCTHSSGRSCTR